MFRHRRFVLIFGLIVFVLIIRKRSDRCVESNREFYLNSVYIKELNVLYCVVPKAASTNLRRVLLVRLNQTNNFDDLDRKQIWIDQKRFFEKYYLTRHSQDLFDNENILKFIIVRHPFRRISSVYNDKFVNNHFDDTLSGWKQLEEEILVEMKTNESRLTIRRNEIRLDFRTFVLYIIKSIAENRSINSHWERISSRCRFCSLRFNSIIKIENFENDQQILMKYLTANQLNFPSKELDSNSNKQQQSLDDYQVFELFRTTIDNDQQFRILIDYYRTDFQLFKYVLPQI